VARVRAANPLPLYVGFGIATPEDAARVARCADGAVVGSALIRTIDEASDATAAVTRARDFLARMNIALNPEKGSSQ
jgi:tryptophan synthase alpha chain